MTIKPVMGITVVDDTVQVMVMDVAVRVVTVKLVTGSGLEPEDKQSMYYNRQH